MVPVPATPETYDAGSVGSPPGRYWHDMAYDSNRKRIVLFGGASAAANPAEDTWEYDGTTWTQLNVVPRPPARSAHAMAFDAARGRVVLNGGYEGTSNWLDDTWEWDGSSWTEITTATSMPATTIRSCA